MNRHQHNLIELAKYLDTRLPVEANIAREASQEIDTLTARCELHTAHMRNITGQMQDWMDKFKVATFRAEAAEKKVGELESVVNRQKIDILEWEIDVAEMRYSPDECKEAKKALADEIAAQQKGQQ